MRALHLFWAIGCVIGFAQVASAEIIEAASGAPADLQDAVDRAAAGDTVQIPAGTFPFAGTVTIDVPLTLRGAGQLDTVLAGANATGENMLVVSASEVTISDLTLRGQPQGSGDVRDYGVTFSNSIDFVVVRCTFQDFGGAAISAAGDDTRGVVSQSEFIDIFRPEIDNYGYGVVVMGSSLANWERPFVLGSQDFVFIEDCRFQGNRHAVASNRGSRYVFRHNQLFDPRPTISQHIDAHGWEYGSDCGSRGYEIYGNTVTTETGTSWAGITIRGGDGVIYDNVFLAGINRPILLSNRLDGGADCATYPNPYQTRELYVWDNTHLGEEVGVTIYSGHECLFEEDREFFYSPPAGYTPYPYPHPLLDGSLVDVDGDGSLSDVDCDDLDAAIHPGADERCNDVDDNCDGTIDEGCPEPTLELVTPYLPDVVVDATLTDLQATAGVTFADDSGRSEGDNSATVWAAWSDTHLFIGYDVRDTELNAEAVDTTGEVYRDDNMEIYIDRNNDHETFGGADDSHFAVNLHNVATAFDDEVPADYESAVALVGTLNDNGDVDTGYRIELAIAWSLLGGLPNVGDRIGIDLCAADRDEPADGYNYYDWAELTHFAEPSQWGDLVIGPAPDGGDAGPGPDADVARDGGADGGSDAGDEPAAGDGGCSCLAAGHAAWPARVVAWLLLS